MTKKLLSARLISAAGLVVLGGLLSGCATYDTSYPRTTSSALTGYETTTLSRFFEAGAAAHPGKSGVRILTHGREALRARLAMADVAEHTVDVQYYIWDADVAGGLIAERLMDAADRGVRVRILLDDISIKGRDSVLARASGHRNVEIRAFNPFRDRSRVGDLFSDPSRVNRRSHNKIFIVDNSAAIVGGRNIADHYFGVHDDSNYRDLDIAAVGPVVRDISAVFDDFWNSEYAVPYAAFVSEEPTEADAAAEISALHARVAATPEPYPIASDVAAVTEHLDRIRADFLWAPVRVLYDDPAKVDDKTVKGIVGELRALTTDAQQEVLIENAYFVPRDRMVEVVGDLTSRGVKVRILTNSLASNDVAAVYSGYAKHRTELLENGAEMYELRPDSAMSEHWSALSTRSRAGLHTKAMVVDRSSVVIGSYNLDPRSADINSELALLVESSELAERVVAYFDTGVQPENSYRVYLDDGKTRWSTETEGKTQTYKKAPETTGWQRFVSGLIGILPIESQL